MHLILSSLPLSLILFVFRILLFCDLLQIIFGIRFLHMRRNVLFPDLIAQRIAHLLHRLQMGSESGREVDEVRWAERAS